MSLPQIKAISKSIMNLLKFSDKNGKLIFQKPHLKFHMMRKIKSMIFY